MSRAKKLYEASWNEFDTHDTFDKRQKMVDRQLAARDITDEQVLDVMRYLPRHFFIPSEPAYQNRAYDDTPVDIGNGQTISQPYMVAWMTQLLDVNETHRVLDVGTGSGYQAAILAALGADVYAIEYHEALIESATKRFTALGLTNITTTLGDGSQGLHEHQPYDRIIVAAGAPSIPKPLLQQLAPNNGKLVIPVGSRKSQELTLVIRDGERLSQTTHGGCIFVPLLGQYGWS